MTMQGAPQAPLYGGAPAGAMVAHQGQLLVTTSNDLPGWRVVHTIGVVRGIVVRSRSVVGNFVAGLQMIFGGNITIYTQLCESAREDAFRIMVDHARQWQANGIIAMRYDATELLQGVTEVLAYGTAVRVEPM
jgi:uncharacterized protein YbjQ (UPF0145 family)